MDVLISNWSNVQAMPENFILPPEKRPGKNVPVGIDIPVIDLAETEGHSRAHIVQKIVKACQEYGLFQVVNHGVSETLMEETMDVLKEFFRSPAEYKAKFSFCKATIPGDASEKSSIVVPVQTRSCHLYNSSMMHRNENEPRYWRDCLVKECFPLEVHEQFWPENPARYREVVREYSIEVRKFLFRVLDLISEGLGIEDGHFEGEISKTQLMAVNHHIPCPEPTLTLAHPEHCDPNLITTLQQCDVPGLQVLKTNGQWVGVEPIPHAFVLVPGVQFRAISNGTFLSPKHRVVTNEKEHRTTIGTFFVPSGEALIEPAGRLDSSAKYKAYKYKEFLVGWKNVVSDDSALERFKIKA